MKKTLFALIAVLLFFYSFSQERVVILGSSTAAGTGASVYDSSWVGRLQLEFRKNTAAGNPDTVVTNLAVGGTTTYYAMPTGYTPPPNRPSPDPEHNVTKALSFNPTVVIVNFPTNDIGSGYTAKEYMDNLRFLYQYINATGARAYIATTQPRSQFTFERRQILWQLVDSINRNFGLFAINFWDDLATTDGQYNLKPEVNAGDDVHVNNLGHRLLFQRVKAKNIFTVNAPLPLVLTDFAVQKQNEAALITWRTVNETAATFFEVQRSANRLDFETLTKVTATGDSQGAAYSWTDNAPLRGENFYRLKMVEANTTSYSKIIGVAFTQKKIRIHKAHTTPAGLEIELLTDKDRMITATIVSVSGAVVYTKTYPVKSPAITIQLPVSNLSSGTYILRIDSGDAGENLRFSKLP